MALAAIVVGVVVLATPRTALAADQSSYLEITDLWILDSEGVRIDLGKGDDPANYDPANYSNGLSFSERCGWGFGWKLNLDDGHQLHDGDTVTLKLFWQANVIDLASSPLYDQEDTQIGVWEVQGSTVKLTFNANVEGHTSLEQGWCETSTSYTRGEISTNDEIKTISLTNSADPGASLTRTFLAEKTAFKPMYGSNSYKVAGQAGNNEVVWGLYFGREAEVNLTNGRQTKYYEDTYLEDTVQGDIEIRTMVAPVYYPLTGAGTATADASATSGDIAGKFTELTQASGETLEEFRARVKAKELNYGVYKDEATGQSTFMMYLGRFPNERIGTWEDAGAFAAVDSSTQTSWTDQSENDRKVQWKAAHGTSNAYNGLINMVAVILNVTYEQVVTDTDVSNTLLCTYDDKTETPTSRNTLKPISGQAVPRDPATVELVKFDESTNAVIPGAEFRLEWREPSQAAWNSFGGASVTYTADPDGKVVVDNLPNADREYRFVEVEPATGYIAGSQKFYKSLGSDPIEGEVHFRTTTGDSQGTLIYCSNKKTQYGDVVVSKTLEGNTQDANRDFEVTVTAKLDGEPVADGTYGDAVFSNGEATLTLRGGQSKTIAQLQEDTVYTIKEADYSTEGYVTSYRDASDRTITLTGGRVQGTVGANTRDFVTVVNAKNTYSALTVNKAIAGNAASTSDEFGFKVTITAGDTITEETFTLKGGQDKVFEDIPNGATYVVEETDDRGYASAVTAGSATGTIVGGTDASVTFTNTLDTYGDLALTKIAEGHNPDKVASFDFTVTLDDASVEGTYGGMTFSAGVARVSVASGETVTAVGLPNGVGYSIEEDDYSGDGFVTESEGHAGTIVGGETKQAVFTNIREADGTLTVSKTVDGSAANDDDVFTFVIELSDSTVEGDFSGVAFEAGAATIELSGGESLTIEGLPHDVSYTVTETDALDYTADAATHEGTIDEDAPAVAAFTNRRSYVPVLVDPPVQKIVEGTNEADEFTFVLRAVSSTVADMTSASMPMPAGSEAGVKQIAQAGAGEWEFGEFAIELPGTYVYEVSEAAGTLHYHYDDSVYIVTYVVEAEGTALVATCTVTKGGEVADVATFTNVKIPTYGVIHRYEGEYPEDVKATLPVDEGRYRDGTVVYPLDPSSTSVDVEGGTWVFKGWDVDSHTIAGEDVEFVGTWEHVPDPDPKSPNPNPNPNPDPGPDPDPKTDPKSDSGTKQGTTSSGGGTTHVSSSGGSGASKSSTPSTGDSTSFAWVGFALAGVAALAATRLAFRRD